jgi:hypothetical protein
MCVGVPDELGSDVSELNIGDPTGVKELLLPVESE